jgi:hypothetical protein
MWISRYAVWQRDSGQKYVVEHDAEKVARIPAFRLNSGRDNIEASYGFSALRV